MVAVPDLDAVDAGLGEVVDDGGEVGVIFAAELHGVGDGGQAAGLVNAVDGLAGREAFLVEKGERFAVEVNIEGLLDAGDGTRIDEGLGDVGAADDDGLAGFDALAGEGFDLLRVTRQLSSRRRAMILGWARCGPPAGWRTFF